MRGLLLLLLLIPSCGGGPTQDIAGIVRTYVSLVREPGADLAAIHERLHDARAAGYRVELFHRKSTMPDGPRQWLTFKLYGPPAAVEQVLIEQLGKPNGRGFGDEDGWLLPTGGLILERFENQRDITFSPGPPEDALEDLARPHLPSRAEMERRALPFVTLIGSPRLIGVRVRAAAAAALVDGLDLRRLQQRTCFAHGNYFIVPGGTEVHIWRRPLAMWNVEIQETCAKRK